MGHQRPPRSLCDTCTGLEAAFCSWAHSEREPQGFALTRGFPHHMGWRLVDLAVVQENGLEAATAASLLISEEGVTLGRENTRHHSGQVYLTNPKYPGQVVIDQRVSREACVVKQSVGCVELRSLARHPLVVRRAGGAAEEVEVVTQGTVMMHDGDSLWLVSARAFSVHVTGLGVFRRCWWLWPTCTAKPRASTLC